MRCCLTLIRLLSVLFGLGALACKFEPINRLQEEAPAPQSWPALGVAIPEQTPKTEASRELAQHLATDYDTISTLDSKAAMPDSTSPLLRYLIQGYNDAMLAPEGDNRTWTQAVPLRHLQTTSWKFDLSLGKDKGALKQKASDGAANWVFRQYRDAGKRQETFQLVQLSPSMLSNPAKFRRVRTRGRFVLLDATAYSQQELAQQLLDPDAPWFEQLSRLGAVGCMVFTSLSPEDGLWLQVKHEFASPFTELLAPGEAPPARLEMVAIANSSASEAWSSWHGGETKPRGPERAGQGPTQPPPTVAIPRHAEIEQKGRIVIDMTSQATWDSEYSVLGRQPGSIRPEKVVLVLTRWNGGQDPAKDSSDRDDSNDVALAAQLGLMRTAFEWRERGRRSDTSIVFGSLYGGHAASNAGLRQFLRQKTVRTENILAVFWLESMSTRNDAIDVAVHSSTLPRWLSKMLDQYGGHRLRIAPPRPLSPGDPLRVLAPLGVPVVTFTQAPWTEIESPSSKELPSFAPLAELVERFVELAWAVSELDDKGPDTSTTGPVTPP